MKINKFSPNFAVANIKKTVGFYEECLGFRLVMAIPESKDGVEQTLDSHKEYVFAMMQKDNVEFMFQRSDSFKDDLAFAKDLEAGTTVSFYLKIEGIKELHQKLKAKKLELTELRTTWYGMQEFYVKDPDGYMIGFAEKEEQQ